MIKKVIASAAVAGLLSVSVAANAAPIAFESATRAASPIGDAEEMEGGSGILIALIVAAVAAGLIVLIENNEGDVDDLPASP